MGRAPSARTNRLAMIRAVRGQRSILRKSLMLPGCQEETVVATQSRAERRLPLIIDATYGVQQQPVDVLGVQIVVP